MALKVDDHVKETTSTTGTGTWNLAGLVIGFQTFVAGIGNGNTTPYQAENPVDKTEWETGIGTVTDAAPDTLTRSVLTSSNGDNLVNFTNAPVVGSGWISDVATMLSIMGAITASSTDTLTNKKITDDSNEVHAEAVFDRVRNDSGGTLARGTPVYASGYNSGQEVVLVDKADADDPAKMPAIGIIDTDIANNANGHIVTRGDVTGFNTSGFTVLDKLYISTTAGVLTATRPTAATTEVQQVAIVLRAHATLGIISVVGAGRANDIPNDIPEFIAIAVSDETTDLEVATGVATFRMPYAFTLSAVRISVTTAPTGATIIVDINESGATILSTKLSIDATEKTSTTAATPAVISDAALADDAEITIDIDQIGSTIAGTGLKIYLIGTQS